MTVYSPLMNPDYWQAPEWATDDLTYHISHDGQTARVAFNRPEVLNAFRPETVDQLLTVFARIHHESRIGVVLLTGNGPSKKHGKWSFCTGGDQNARGPNGYQYAADTHNSKTEASQKPLGRLHILEVQRAIRFLPKVVIAVVPGWAAGGGHSLHVVCDLTIASREHAQFKQTDADVASFDGGYGSAYLAKQVGQKKAREIFFLGETYDAETAAAMGTVNRVCEHENLESDACQWAELINQKSPTAIRMLKYAMNLPDDGMVGQQLFAGEATRLAYGTDEAIEGRQAFLDKRPVDYTSFPWAF